MELEKPFVAIWMITYNHVDYIEAAVHGVMIQKTNFPYKLYLSEDCSTDGTREKCQELKSKYPDKIELFLPEKNIGISGINNIAIITYKTCFDSGAKYIALCEGDDYWVDSSKLQKQIDFLEKNSSFSGVFHETQTIDKKGNLGKVYGQSAPETVFLKDTFTTTCAFHTSSFLFRREYLILPNWFSKILSGDMALFSIIASRGSIKKIPEIMSMYRKHESGLTSQTSTTKNYHQQRIELFELLDEHFNFMYASNIQYVIGYHKQAIEACSQSHFKKNLRKGINYLFRLFR